MRKINLKILMAVCVFMMTLTVPAGADTHIVLAGQSIQAAIDAASNGDEIEVAPGTYYEAINFNGKAVRLYSSGGPYATTIDANGAYHVVQCVSGEGANTILEGFTITGGNANGTSWPDNCGGGMVNEYHSNPIVTDCIFSGNSAGSNGGGVYNYSNSYPSFVNCIFTGNVSGAYGGGMSNGSSSPTLTNCIIGGNKAGTSGGGMYNSASNPTVTNCTFTGNMATYDGGGMYNKSSSSPTLTNCTFSGNTATYGGGMSNSDSSPTVTNCIIGGNKANSIGGGMYNEYYSSPIVTNCIIGGNKAGTSGGGMANLMESSPTVTNCMFSGNTATYDGGGMCNNSSSSPTLTNCTFSGNTATYGGGMSNYDSCNPVVTNCILWGNSPNQILDWSGTSCSTTVTYSDVQGGWPGAGGNNINADPCFVDAIGGNLRLSSGSPCIDKGSNAGVPPGITTDLAGNPRVLDGDSNGTVIVDMGAYEYIETLRLVAHWKLDEYYGPTAHDSAGENHGTLQGGPFWLPTWGKVGGALQLDGVNDYVDCGNDDSLSITGQITLALWVKTNDSGNGQYNSYITKGDHSYGLQHKYNNNVEFFFSDGVNWYWVWYPVNSSFNGVWHHLAGTYDGSQLKLYVDGELKAGSSHTGSIGSSTYNVNIGRNSEATDRLYNGLIDDVRIYNYALSADEILQLLCTRQINEDLDGNCKVDFRDLALLVSEWLTSNLPSYELCWE